MGKWTDVVTHPLGLAGFVLFLVFAYLARTKEQRAKRWLRPIAMLFACVALVGGIWLAYAQISHGVKDPLAPSQPPPSAQLPVGHVEQRSTGGTGSPNIQGVSGNVTVTVDQSSAAEKTTLQVEKPQ